MFNLYHIRFFWLVAGPGGIDDMDNRGRSTVYGTINLFAYDYIDKIFHEICLNKGYIVFVAFCTSVFGHCDLKSYSYNACGDA